MPQHGSGSAHTVNSCRRISIDSPHSKLIRKCLPICDEVNPCVSTGMPIEPLALLISLSFAKGYCLLPFFSKLKELTKRFVWPLPESILTAHSGSDFCL